MLGIAMEFIQIAVEHREETGKGPMRRLRRAGKVPGVLYGLGRRNLPLTIPQEEVDRFLKTGSHLVELRMGENKRQAIIREVQHDTLSDEILHIDFHRVDADVEIETNVLIEWKGEAPGAKEGGVFQGLMETIHVRSRPADLPRVIIIEIDSLGVGDSIHLSDVALPERVVAVGADDALVCQVVVPKVTAEETAEDEAEEEGGEGAPAVETK
jgi:large subunit ribosomal protein L25